MEKHLDNDCLFCKIIRGEIPSQKVYENESVLAFKDISPQAPVHVLIIPKHHIPAVTALDSENSAFLPELFAAANEIAKELKLESGFRLVINCGEHAGQTVFHLHMHLLGGTQLGLNMGVAE